MIDDLSERALTAEWRDLLAEAGRMQPDACATLRRAEAYGYRSMHLQNARREVVVMILEADLKLSIDGFAQKYLKPAVHQPGEPC